MEPFLGGIYIVGFTFALPGPRHRVPVHYGEGASVNAYGHGEAIGSEHITLTTSQIPAHFHSIEVSNAATTLKLNL
jgi:microcystin-dependent protein